MTWHTIIGAINVYLMIGLAFAFVYDFIYLLWPDAFQVSDSFTTDYDLLMSSFLYFSFVSLTTLGYGDIVPNVPEVGVVAYTEALTGQIYLVVMVARLVSLHASHHPDET